MKKSALFVTVALFSLPAMPMLVHAANPQQVGACVTQMTDKNITDAKSAQKVCTCVVDEQAKITQAQKNEIDNWVKSGKDVRQNSTYQTIVNKLKACGNGIKFNRPQQ